jgi:hypothetical protein
MIDSITNIIDFATREMSLTNVDTKLQPLILRIIRALDSTDLKVEERLHALNLAEQLYGFMPLTPLTGEDSEWSAFENDDAPFTHINIRCPRVIKTEDGKAIDVMSYSFFDERSIQYVEFPYMPVSEGLVDG